MQKEYLRGDIYYANLNPVIGSEQSGERPVLILQNDIGNKHSPTVIIAPMTTKINKRASFPTHVLFETNTPLSSLILLEQIRTIDKNRLLEYVGKVDDETMCKVDEKVLVSLGVRR